MEDKLSKITIRGYKSIAYDHPVELRLQDVTLLLGANGSGKSNILSFFKMLSAVAHQNLQQHTEMAGTTQAVLHHGAKRTPQLEATIEGESASRIEHYEMLLRSDANDRFVIAAEALGVTSPTSEALLPSLEMKDVRESGLLTEAYAHDYPLVQRLRNIRYYQFHDTSTHAPLRTACPEDGADYLLSDGSNIAAFLLLLREQYSFNYARIVDYVRWVMPQFRDFYLVPRHGYVRLQWLDTSGTDYVFSAHHLSDGSLRFIALATVLLQPAELMPKLLLLDEPELGLHPWAVDQLAFLLENGALHTQILLATQSKELIDHFEPEQVAVVDYQEEHHASTLTHFTEEELRLWLEDYTLSELWDKNIIGGRP